MCGGFVLAQRVRLADTFLKRLKGLMLEKSMDEGFGLLITPCRQIHTFGMRFNIDVLFLSKDFEVLETEQDFAPGRISRYVRESAYVLELAGGALSGKVQIGQKLEILNSKNQKQR